ncbi:Response regulator [Heracleum sosnowskyi]|uniref:Response regulator n=1 Tax=Heracleum sosnowskyi TaxID=360622 RepID=A0AAD8M395_9APIA|nr:Response regulator [Heracleum sosnowskyi]
MAEEPSVGGEESSKVTTTTTTVDGGHKGKWRPRWGYGGWRGYGGHKGDGKGYVAGKTRRSISQFIVTLFVLAAVIALILWLIYRPYKPKFTLVSAAVFNLTTSTPPFISTTMQFTIVTRNPNERSSIHYDRLSAFVTYKNQMITPQLMLPPLHQRKDSTVSMSPILGGAAVPVSLDLANGILMDMEGYGLVQLRLVLQGRIKYKAGVIKTSHYDLYVTCDMLLGLKKGMVGQVPLLNANHYADQDQDHHPCKVDT